MSNSGVQDSPRYDLLPFAVLGTDHPLSREHGVPIAHARASDSVNANTRTYSNASR